MADEYPHPHHHHHRRDDDDEGRRDDRYGRGPPPPSYGGRIDEFAQPPPAYGGRIDDFAPPPPAYGGRINEFAPPHPSYGRTDYAGDGGYGQPPPAYGQEGGYGRLHREEHVHAPPAYGRTEEEGYGRPHREEHVHAPPAYGRTEDEGYGGRPHPPPAARQPTVRIVCKGNEGVSLAIRDGVVLLARTDQNDDHQHWIKDMRYSTRVKDEEGYPAFALINKATGEALKHALGQSHPVRFTRYDPETLDESVLWTESRDVGAGYRCIRMVNNIYLNFDALHGDKDHGGVHDGTTLTLWKWCEGDNQRWKIVPW